MNLSEAVAYLRPIAKDAQLDGYKAALTTVLDAVEGAEEPEWEYAWAGTDDEGDEWVMDEAFGTRESAEAYAGRPIGRWVQTDNGQLVRRRKAGPWIWVPVEGSES